VPLDFIYIASGEGVSQAN